MREKKFSLSKNNLLQDVLFSLFFYNFAKKCMKGRFLKKKVGKCNKVDFIRSQRRTINHI